MATLKFASYLKELRIHLCQNSASSNGVRDFIGKHYANIKQNNPKLPILVRESNGIEPKLWARYEYGRESNAPLSGLNAEQILQQLLRLTAKK